MSNEDKETKEQKAQREAAEKLAKQEKEAAVAAAQEAGYDIWDKADGSLIRLNREPATVAKAKELKWKLVK